MNQRPAHEKDNERLLKLLGRPDDSAFPADIVWANEFVIWPENISKTIRGDYALDEWNAWKQEAEQELGQPGGLEKNSICISSILAKAWDAGKRSATLERLCETILNFARNTTS